MDRRRKKSRRKVIPLLYQKKNVPPLSQMLTITSQTKKIKNLIQNNRALAFAAHEAHAEVTTYKDMLQDYLKDRNQIMFAQMKIKDMAETIKKLVSDLEEVSACLNLSSKDILPTLTDYTKHRSKETSLSTIQEADISLSEEESLYPTEEGKDCTPLEVIQENSNNVEDIILSTDSASRPEYYESVRENASKELIANNEEGISPSLEKQSNTVDVVMSQPSLVAEQQKSLIKSKNSKMERKRVEERIRIHAEKENFSSNIYTGRKSKRYSEGCAPKGEKSAFSNIENSNEFNEVKLLNEYPKKLQREDSPLFKKPVFFETNLIASKIPILMQSEDKQNKLTENFKKPKGKENRRETFVISACKANTSESSISSNQRRGTFVISHPETSKSNTLDRRGTYVVSSPEHNKVDRRGTYILSTFDEQSTKAVDKPIESNLSHTKTCESTVLNNTILLSEDMELTEVITFANTFPTKNNVNGLETSTSPPSVTVDTNKDTQLHDEIQAIVASERSEDKLVSQKSNSFETRLLCENGSVPTETEDLEKVIFSDQSTKGSAKQSLSKKSVTKKSIPVKYLEDFKSSEVLEKPASEILEKETTFFNGICALDPVAVIQAESTTKPRLSQRRKVRKSIALYKKESISKLLEGKDDVQNVGKDAALQNSQCSETKEPKVSKSGSLRGKKSLMENSKEERDYSDHGLQYEKVPEKSEEERTCMPETLSEGISSVVPLGHRVSKRCKSAQKYSVYFTSDSESNSTSDEDFIVKPRKAKNKRIGSILPKEEVKGENKMSETSHKEKSLSDSANQRISERSKYAKKFSEFSTDLETSITLNEELNKEPEIAEKEKELTIKPRRVLKGKNKYKFAFRKRASSMPSNDETKNQKLKFDEKNIFYFSSSPEKNKYEFSFRKSESPMPSNDEAKNQESHKEKSLSDSANQRISERSKSAQKFSEFSTDLETSITLNEESQEEPEITRKEKKWVIQPRRRLKGKNKYEFAFRKRASPMPSNDETKNQESHKEKSRSDSANQRISKRSKSALFEFSTDLETSITLNEESQEEPEIAGKEKKWAIQPRSVLKDKNKYEFAVRKKASPMPSNDEKNIFYFSSSPETGSSSSDGRQTQRNCHSEEANDQETVSVSQINDIKEIEEKLLSSEQKKPAKVSIQNSYKLSAITGGGCENCNAAESSSHKDNADKIENKSIADSRSVSETNECHKKLELTTGTVKVLKNHRGKNTRSNKSHAMCTDVSKKHVEYSPEAAETEKMALSKNEAQNKEENFVLNDGSEINPKNVAKQENILKEKSRKSDFESFENSNECLDVAKNKSTEIRVSDTLKEKCKPLDVVEWQLINKERDLDCNLVSSKTQSYDKERNRRDNKIENDSGKINYDIQEEVIENPAGKFSAFDNDNVQSQKNKRKISSSRKSILTTKIKNTDLRKVSISTKRVSICENVTYFDQKVDISKPLSEANPVKEASKLICKLQSHESTDVADIQTGASKSNSSNKFDLFQDSVKSNEKLTKVAINQMPKRSGNEKLDKSLAEDVVDLDVLTTATNCVSDKQVKVDKAKEENNSVFSHKEQPPQDDIVNVLKHLLSERPISAEPVLIGTSFAKISKATGKSKTKKSNKKEKKALSHDENVCTLNLVNPEIKPTLSKDAKSDAETDKKKNKSLPLKKKSSSKQTVDLCKEDLEENSISAVKEKESRSLPACIANDLNLLDKPSNSTNDASGRKRRARPISYKEPSLNAKLRRNF